MSNLSDEEYLNRLNEIMPELISKGKCKSKEQLDEVYRLHNLRLKPMETGKHCGKCRARVFKRLKDYYLKLIEDEKNYD